jgi:hypothetical protein
MRGAESIANGLIFTFQRGTVFYFYLSVDYLPPPVVSVKDYKKVGKPLGSPQKCLTFHSSVVVAVIDTAAGFYKILQYVCVDWLSTAIHSLAGFRNSNENIMTTWTFEASLTWKYAE